MNGTKPNPRLNLATEINVLLIEDNPADARLIREMLLEAGNFKITRADSLATGVAVAQQTMSGDVVIDIVLLDLSLPDSFGLETLMRLLETAPELPIVVLTGYEDRRTGVQAVQSGAQDFIAKGEVHAGLLQRAILYAIERQRMRKELTELTAIQERQRLARDLHDSVSQTLFTTSVIAQSAMRNFGINPEKAYDLLGQVHSLTQNALAEMRLLLLELRPKSLEQASFEQLLDHLVQSVQGREGLVISAHIEPNAPHVPATLKLPLYRIMQEALNNVLKHAGASEVVIALIATEQGAQLSISDDGRGFDVEQAAHASLGMSIMRERAEASGAALSVESTPGMGSQICISWS